MVCYIIGAFEVLKLVQKAGLKADCKLYTTLISTCAKSKKVDTMFKVCFLFYLCLLLYLQFYMIIRPVNKPNEHEKGMLMFVRLTLTE